MDPITLASNRFHSEFKLYWDPPPGQRVPGPRVLRVAVDYPDRKDALKSLRLLECQPENRRPFVIVEGACGSEGEFLAGIARKLEEDHAKLVKGLADDGIELTPIAPIPRPVTIKAIQDALVSSSTEVAKVLDGLVVVLMPDRIQDAKSYRAVVDALAPLSNDVSLRLAAQDQPGLDANYAGVATFQIDQAALLQYLKQMGQAKSKGPPANAPKATPAQKAAVEKATGKPFASEATGTDLRALLLDAGDAMSKAQFKVAAKKFRAARMLCHLIGLPDEEAATSIALGSAILATGDRVAAIAAFRKGKELALARENRLLAAQAEFGVAGTYFFATEYRNARASYAEIMKLAHDVPGLKLEAIRMEGECFLGEARPSDAITSFGEAVEGAAQLPDDVRKTTSYAHSGKALVAVLDKTGQAARARAAETRLAALADERPHAEVAQ